MGDLGQLAKIKYLLSSTNGENKEEFSIVGLNIRNRNREGYRYYDELINTKKIENDQLGTAFISYDFTNKDDIFVEVFVITDLDVVKNMIGKHEGAWNIDETKLGETLKERLRGYANETLTKVVEDIKNKMETTENKSQEIQQNSLPNN